MANYLYVYHGGSMPDTEEERNQEMAAWGAWFQGLGSSVVDPGNPAGPAKTVSADGVSDNGGANPASGYSLVSADNLDAAVAKAQDCPIVKRGGSVEVAEIFEVQM